MTGCDGNVVAVTRHLCQSGRPVSREDVEALDVNTILSVGDGRQPWADEWVRDGWLKLQSRTDPPRLRAYAWVPLIDSDGMLDPTMADAAIAFGIRALEDPGRFLLVHCDAGAFRSVHISACILARMHDMDPREAFAKVDRARGARNPRESLGFPDWRAHLDGIRDG